MSDILRGVDERLQPEWLEAVKFYQSKKAVLFLSYCRFWEKHGFVQQSLARYLLGQGVRVTWFDGVGWRPYRPMNNLDKKRIKVTQLTCLPMDRFKFVHQMNKNWTLRQVKREIAKLGDPIVWVQGGISEELADGLESIDVFSVFDDPYRHRANGPLCQKAKIILCQNQFALQLLQPDHSKKAYVSFPPVDVRPEVFHEEVSFMIPARFPKQRVGYVGSFFYKDYDFELFESAIRRYPSLGFILAGRTDDQGESKIQKLKAHYTNFLYLPWVPRDQVANAWKTLSLSLLFYRREKTQDGAFPTKILESLYFGVPIIATAVPKTMELRGYFYQSGVTEELLSEIPNALQKDPRSLEKAFTHFAHEMHPKKQLIEVAHFLKGA